MQGPIILVYTPDTRDTPPSFRMRGSTGQVDGHFVYLVAINIPLLTSTCSFLHQRRGSGSRRANKNFMCFLPPRRREQLRTGDRTNLFFLFPSLLYSSGLAGFRKIPTDSSICRSQLQESPLGVENACYKRRRGSHYTCACLNKPATVAVERGPKTTATG